MGLILGIETDTGQETPYSYSDALRYHLFTLGIPDEPLTILTAKFPINLDPLTGDRIVDLESMG